MLGAGIYYPRTAFMGDGDSSPMINDWLLAPAFARDTLEIGNEGYDHAGFLSSMIPVSLKPATSAAAKFSYSK